jgi:quercetin dioxygenase-like cupin family protein
MQVVSSRDDITEEAIMRKLATCVGIVGLLVGATALNGQGQPQTGHGLFLASEVKWGPAPPSLPPGAQAALLEGDPAKDGLFTLRLKLPDGYRIPPHFHPVVEHVTVIQGSFVLGMGDKATDTGTKTLTAGAFAFMPAGMRHFVQTQGETVVQLHGTGPWGITYVNPSDDPRKK